MEHAEVEFFQPIKKMKLKTFINMKKTVKVSVKDKVVPIRSHSNLFGQLALIMQTRNVNLKEIFEYPLGPYPWSLCGDMGELRKTNKSSLMHILEKDVETEETVDGSYVTIIDGDGSCTEIENDWQDIWRIFRQFIESDFVIRKRYPQELMWCLMFTRMSQ